MTNEELMAKGVRVMRSSKNNLHHFWSACTYCELVGRELIRRRVSISELMFFWERIEEC